MTSDMQDSALGCLLGGLIGDSMGTPTENLEPDQIQQQFGWLDRFEGDGTDDSIMKYLLCDALIETGGYATADDWGLQWLGHPDQFRGEKRGKFFESVLHTQEKLSWGYSPRQVSAGNMPSSSSAMAIAPVGIVNAGNPRAASAQAQEIASLIHTGEASFCQDGAAIVAAAIAAAFLPSTGAEESLRTSLDYLKPASGTEMRDLVTRAVELARAEGDYDRFRAAYHTKFRRAIPCDSRETIPATVAICLLADGDPVLAITYAANFGRDTDTIATMAGAICGALRGARAFPKEWIAEIERYASRNQPQLAALLLDIGKEKGRKETDAWRLLTVVE